MSSRRIARQINEAYEERDKQLQDDVRQEVALMHLDQTTELVVAALPQQRRWYQPSHGTHRPIGVVEHERARARATRHRVIDLRDKVVTTLELDPWKSLLSLQGQIDLEELTAFALS